MENQEYLHVKHEFDPVYDRQSEILILGTFPSVASREHQFYYGHKQNRFWKVLALLYEEPVPTTIEEKRSFLLRNHIAIWDVIVECDIVGSADSSIRNVIPTDLKRILEEADIRDIYANGATAEQLYNKYSYSVTGRNITKLPSTSPANAAYTLEKLVNEWSVIRR